MLQRPRLCSNTDPTSRGWFTCVTPANPTVVHTLRHPPFMLPFMLPFQLCGALPSALPSCQTRLRARAQHTGHTLCFGQKCSLVDHQLRSVLWMSQFSTTALVRHHYGHKKYLFKTVGDLAQCSGPQIIS